MRLTDRDIAAFIHLNRYHYLRRTFMHALLGIDLDAEGMSHRITELHKTTYLARPEKFKETANYRYSPRVYTLGPRGEDELLERGIPLVQWTDRPREHWHQLMISDIVASVEIACREQGFAFRHRNDFFDKPLHLSALDGLVKPDELFTVNGTPFILEADRSNEPSATSLERSSSWAKKLAHYSDVLKKRTYEREWGFRSIVILCMFARPRRAENVRTYLYDKVKKATKSIAFRGVMDLGSHDLAPKPLASILTDPWQRAGHEPLTILGALEKQSGYRTHEDAHRAA